MPPPSSQRSATPSSLGDLPKGESAILEGETGIIYIYIYKKNNWVVVSKNIFTPTWGDDLIWWIFSDGLKLPTRQAFLEFTDFLKYFYINIYVNNIYIYYIYVCFMYKICICMFVFMFVDRCMFFSGYMIVQVKMCIRLFRYFVIGDIIYVWICFCWWLSTMPNPHNHQITMWERFFQPPSQEISA